ncbi:hypothetical protein [Sphingomonas sp.]|uniref:hypothetical protein n=1 Tax=Sphingomonas sp. TaxID=28214 RepID=UPI002DF01F0A|nr:hypothetical protein [Sphingomonas sp.]
MTKSDLEDRFDIPAQLIIDVIRAHRGIWRDGCYVPTRGEVAEAPAATLGAWLLGWWWESPAELIPTDAQVEAVLAILRARPDAASPEIRRIIAQAPPPSDGEHV